MIKQELSDKTMHEYMRVIDKAIESIVGKEEFNNYKLIKDGFDKLSFLEKHHISFVNVIGSTNGLSDTYILLKLIPAYKISCNLINNIIKVKCENV